MHSEDPDGHTVLLLSEELRHDRQGVCAGCCRLVLEGEGVCQHSHHRALSPGCARELNTGLLLPRADALTNERLCV